MDQQETEQEQVVNITNLEGGIQKKGLKLYEE